MPCEQAAVVEEQAQFGEIAVGADGAQHDPFVARAEVILEMRAHGGQRGVVEAAVVVVARAARGGGHGGVDFAERAGLPGAGRNVIEVVGERGFQRQLEQGVGAVIDRDDVDALVEIASEAAHGQGHVEAPENAVRGLAAEAGVADDDGRAGHHQRQARQAAQAAFRFDLAFGVFDEVGDVVARLGHFAHRRRRFGAADHGGADVQEAFEPGVGLEAFGKIQRAVDVGRPDQGIVAERGDGRAVDDVRDLVQLRVLGEIVDVADVAAQDLRQRETPQHPLRDVEVAQDGDQAGEPLLGGGGANQEEGLLPVLGFDQARHDGAAEKAAGAGDEETGGAFGVGHRDVFSIAGETGWNCKLL